MLLKINRNLVNLDVFDKTMKELLSPTENPYALSDALYRSKNELDAAIAGIRAIQEYPATSAATSKDLDWVIKTTVGVISFLRAIILAGDVLGEYQVEARNIGFISPIENPNPDLTLDADARKTWEIEMMKGEWVS